MELPNVFQPSPLQQLVAAMMRNERLQGVPRPIVEVVIDETIKALNARIPEHLRDCGLDVIQGNWVAMQCMQCGTLAPAPKVSDKFEMSKAALCTKCKERFNETVTFTPKPGPNFLWQYKDARGRLCFAYDESQVPEECRTTMEKVLQKGARAVLEKLALENADKGGMEYVIQQAEKKAGRPNIADMWSDQHVE